MKRSYKNLCVVFSLFATHFIYSCDRRAYAGAGVRSHKPHVHRLDFVEVLGTYKGPMKRTIHYPDDVEAQMTVYHAAKQSGIDAEIQASLQKLLALIQVHNQKPK